MGQASERTRALIANGLSKGMSLALIAGDADYIASRNADEAAANTKRNGMKAHEFLANGNDGPFKSAAERERAFSHPLYATSEEFRTAVMHKASQSSNEIMGVVVPPAPLTPAALLRAAQEDAYHARKADLFDKSNSKNQVVATAARLEILEMSQNPEFQALERAMEPAPRPLEDSLKATGPWRTQAFPDGTPEEQEEECHRRDYNSLIATPGGKGDGPDAQGRANTTLR